MTLDSNRRRVLQAAGVGAVAVAGCVAPTAPDEPADAAPDAAPPASIDPASAVDVDRVAADPTDVPAPIDRDRPATVSATLETRELVAEVEPGVTFRYMTFGGQVPGPMLRARVGDTVDLTVTNHEDNSTVHNVDLHACRGPGGGAGATVVAPGESANLRFRATYPGAFVYHCAVANVDYHVSCGMYGLVVVEPEGGLAPVDHEFYLGQHEVYTPGRAGQAGHHKFDFGAMAGEDPTYVFINGEKGAITEGRHGAMQVGTGDTARVFFAMGGPNLLSSFHPIGSVWDELYPQGALASPPQRYVQTTPVSPGSAAVATMSFPVPGDFKLVDHSLSRVARKGALAVIHAEGPANPDVFDPRGRDGRRPCFDAF